MKFNLDFRLRFFGIGASTPNKLPRPEAPIDTPSLIMNYSESESSASLSRDTPDGFAESNAKVDRTDVTTSVEQSVAPGLSRDCKITDVSGADVFPQALPRARGGDDDQLYQ
jgi:hypothetical protein